MITYLVNFIHAFIPISLLTGMQLALWTPVYGRKTVRPVIISLVAGLLGGVVIYLVARPQETLTAARASLYAAAILAALCHAGILLLAGKKYRGMIGIGWGASLFFMASLSAVAVFSFLALVAEQALSATSILNTELILNSGGILAGAFLIAALIPLTAYMSKKNGRGVMAGLILLASALLVLQWCAEVLLGMMRLELIELTRVRLSFVAKVAQYSYLFPYMQVLIITALALLFITTRKVVTVQELSDMQKAERRKARSRVMFEMRWFKAALVFVCITFAVLLYYDLYASRPPKISPAVTVTPDAGRLIKVRIDDVKDGNLHRYSYVTDDGHVVRFFLINRAVGQSRIGVVYDACVLCGDMGYIQKKNEIICIACNVRIFIPSIGKGGGCNPVPLQHSVEGGEVVIRAADLDQGARYFSEVMAIKVKDPVTGKELINLKAPHRYEYDGRTYFFESAESAEKFKTSPETYVGGRQS